MEKIDLEKIKEFLMKKKITCTEIDYRIPYSWYRIYYKVKMTDKHEKSFKVNPYDFFYRVLSQNVQIAQDADFKENSIYNVHVRTTTAWTHDSQGKYNDFGTFAKTLILLPYLKIMGINILYLLPIFEVSDAKKKGDVGSPYSVRNLMKLDTMQSETIFEELLTIDDQFRLFIDFCHMHGFKVIVDFPLRTTSRDTELIREHPEAVYWIKQEFESRFKSPYISFMGKESKLDHYDVPKLYKEQSVLEYIDFFSPSPASINPNLFKKIVEESKTSEELLEGIGTQFGLTTAPAFSDSINDSQSQWSDITYLRLYKDNKDYFLFDSINAKKFNANERYDPVWNYLEDVIPNYLKKFSIDGARIDMGHSLPTALMDEIYNRTLRINPKFIFICENLFVDNIDDIEKRMYDYFVGNIWYSEQFRLPYDLAETINKIIEKRVNFFAASGISDTPRNLSRNNSLVNEIQLLILNHFLPNTVPYILSGTEVLEVQPMNLGLISKAKDQFVLDRTDDMYGKLAYFDRYQLHWDRFSLDIVKTIGKVAQLKNDIWKKIDTSNTLIYQENDVLYIEYRFKEREDILILATSFNKEPVKTKVFTNYKEILLYHSKRDFSEILNKQIIKDGELFIFISNDGGAGYDENNQCG